MCLHSRLYFITKVSFSVSFWRLVGRGRQVELRLDSRGRFEGFLGQGESGSDKTHADTAAVNQTDWQHSPGKDPGGKLILNLFFGQVSYFLHLFSFIHEIPSYDNNLYKNPCRESDQSDLSLCPDLSTFLCIASGNSSCGWFLLLFWSHLMILLQCFTWLLHHKCTCSVKIPPSLSTWLHVALSDSSIGRKHASAAVLFSVLF